MWGKRAQWEKTKIRKKKRYHGLEGIGGVLETELVLVDGVR